MSNVTTIGFKEFQNKLRTLDARMQTTVDAYVRDAGMQWAQQAKRSAPVNFGRLRGGISSYSTSKMAAEVVSPVKYSPYVEWGTGTKVSVPADLVNYAIQFKGVKKILGQNPRMFFFMHKPGIETKLFDRVKRYISTPQ